MTKLESLRPPVVPAVEMRIGPGPRLNLSGTISTREPDRNLGLFFRAVHEAAVEDAVHEVTVDVCGLRFVNSSGIRLFIDWAARATRQAGHRYKLRFVRNTAVTWQRVSFSALRNISGDEVAIDDP
jgi:hypothetical protein